MQMQKTNERRDPAGTRCPHVWVDCIRCGLRYCPECHDGFSDGKHFCFGDRFRKTGYPPPCRAYDVIRHRADCIARYDLDNYVESEYELLDAQLASLAAMLESAATDKRATEESKILEYSRLAMAVVEPDEFDLPWAKFALGWVVFVVSAGVMLLAANQWGYLF